MTPKKSYTVHSPLIHDGIRYEIGETVELDDPSAAPLLAAGVVTPQGAKVKRNRAE